MLNTCASPSLTNSDLPLLSACSRIFMSHECFLTSWKSEWHKHVEGASVLSMMTQISVLHCFEFNIVFPFILFLVKFGYKTTCNWESSIVRPAPMEPAILPVSGSLGRPTSIYSRCEKCVRESDAIDCNWWPNFKVTLELAHHWQMNVIFHKYFWLRLGETCRIIMHHLNNNFM